jgi:L-threonylcarbamoyladenylate synthase
LKSVPDTEIERAAKLLRAGRLVAFPTETVYGLGANALDSSAVDRIYEAKGRPPTSPIIVHVHSVELARQLTTEWTERASRLARRFWPGPLTLVLRKHPAIPHRVTAGLDTVGIRMPAHPVAHSLIRYSGLPVAAPSANRFGELSPTTAEHVRASLGDRVDMILDGGPSQVGIESTVLSLAGTRPVLLRPGMVTQEELEALIGDVDVGTVPDGAHPSPGMHARHYSPRTQLTLLPTRGFTIYGRSGDSGRAVPMPRDPDQYAASLYSVLHDLDNENWDSITVEMPPDSPAWAGILDRLRRAASK